MANTGEHIKQVYQEGITEVQRVFGSLDSTPEQRAIAKQTLNDITALLLAHSIKTVESRTALLTGLIVELNQIIESVKVNPPFVDAASKITTVANRAVELLTEEKKNLLTTG